MCVEERHRVTRLAPEARRAQLVEIGVRLVSASSFDEVMIDDVAREAGISRGLLFHYFPSKRDFQVAVAEAAVEEFIDAITPPTNLPPEQQVRAGLEAFIDYIATRREAFLSLVRGAGGGNAELRGVLDQAHDEVADRILAVLWDVFEVEVTPLLRTVVHGYIAFIEEATVRWLTDGGSSKETLVAVLEQISLQVVEAAQQQEPDAAPPTFAAEPGGTKAG